MKGQFALQNILVDELEFNYPEQRLRALFGKMTNWIKKEAAKKGHKQTHVILGFRSELLNHSINLHVNSMNSDLTDIVLHWFMKIDQSGMMKHHKDSLTTQQFEVDITALELRPKGQDGSFPIGKTRQRRHPGSRGRPLIPEFKHNINIDALIQLENTDNLCLFRSIEIARNKSTMNPHQFSRYIKSERRQKMDVDRLMLRSGIPLNLESYAIEEWGDRIQKDYDEQYGADKFRIFAFGEQGNFKPFWMSKKENYEIDLAIYYWEPTEEEEGHYDPVIYPGRLFGGSRHYCFAVNLNFYVFISPKFSALLLIGTILNMIGIAHTNAAIAAVLAHFRTEDANQMEIPQFFVQIAKRSVSKFIIIFNNFRRSNRKIVLIIIRLIQ